MVRRFLSLLLIISLVFPELALAMGGRDSGDPSERVSLVSHGPRGGASINGEDKGNRHSVHFSTLIRAQNPNYIRSRGEVERMVHHLLRQNEREAPSLTLLAESIVAGRQVIDTRELPDDLEMIPSTAPSPDLRGSGETESSSSDDRFSGQNKDKGHSSLGARTSSSSEGASPVGTPDSVSIETSSPVTGSPTKSDRSLPRSSSGEESTPVTDSSPEGSPRRKFTNPYESQTLWGEDDGMERPDNLYYGDSVPGYDDAFGFDIYGSFRSVADVDPELGDTEDLRLQRLLDDPEALARIRAGMKHYHRHILENKETWLQWAARAASVPVSVLAAVGYTGIYFGGVAYLAELNPTFKEYVFKAPFLSNAILAYILLTSLTDSTVRDSDIFSRAVSSAYKNWSEEEWSSFKIWCTRALRAGLTLPTAVLMFFYLYDNETRSEKIANVSGYENQYALTTEIIGPFVALDGALWAWDNVGHVAELVMKKTKGIWRHIISPDIPANPLTSLHVTQKKLLKSDLEVSRQVLNILPDGAISDIYSRIIDIREAKPEEDTDAESFEMAKVLQVIKVLSLLGQQLEDDRRHSPITLHGCSRILSGINAVLATPARSLVLWFLSNTMMREFAEAVSIGEDSLYYQAILPLSILAALIMTVPEAFAEYFGVQGSLNIFKPEEPEATHSSPFLRAGLNLFSVFQAFVDVLPLSVLSLQTIDALGISRYWMFGAMFYFVPEFASGAASLADSYSQKWGRVLNRIWTLMRRCMGYDPSIGTQRDELLRLTEESQKFIKDAHPDVVKAIYI